MSILAVTTCSAAGWKETGRALVDGFARYWPRSVELAVYVEGFDVPRIPNVHAVEFPEWFTAWKARHALDADAHGLDSKYNRRGRPYDFRRDCVRFAHKVAAVTHAALDSDDRDLLIWMDADTLTHAPVDEEWLRNLIFEVKHGSDVYMAWLDRRGTYPECGFILFNRDHQRHAPFMTRLRELYASNAVFHMAETHDSFVIMKTVEAAVAEGWFPTPVSLSGTARTNHHPFPLSELGSRLDHAKGPRKIHGRTPRTEIAGKRFEEHWR